MQRKSVQVLPRPMTSHLYHHDIYDDGDDHLRSADHDDNCLQNVDHDGVRH